MYPSLHSGWGPLRNTSEGPIIPFCKFKKKPFEDPARTSAYAHILVELLWRRMTHQGDLEKSLGWNPVPLFDRERAADMPVMQVLFQFQCLLCRSKSTSSTWLLYSLLGKHTRKTYHFCRLHPAMHLVHILYNIGFIVVYSVVQNANNKKIQADVYWRAAKNTNFILIENFNLFCAQRLYIHNVSNIINILWYGHIRY